MRDFVVVQGMRFSWLVLNMIILSNCEERWKEFFT